MKLIINASNLVSSGGMQVAYSFIHECRKFTGNNYHVFLCPKLAVQVDKSQFSNEFSFYEVQAIPSLTGAGSKDLKKLIRLEEEIAPDCVFTVFGPTYWTPRAQHLMGFAMPHFVYGDSPYFSMIGFRNRLFWKLKALVKMFFFAKNAYFYHVETEDVRVRLAKFLSVSVDRIFTVSNTYNAVYDQDSNTVKHKSLPENENEFRLICISAYYDHKNLEILNKVIPELHKRGFDNFRFVLTIAPEIFSGIFSEEAKTRIFNTGPVPVTECPSLYREVDAAFLPTLLECFSANYPEAMKMDKPILTSDLSFATDVCGDAALYFNPVNEQDIADKIIQLVQSKALQQKLVENGRKRLGEFHSAAKRAERYLEICINLCKK